MSRNKIARLNQEEIIRLGTPKPSFSNKDKAVLLLSQQDGIAMNELIRRAGVFSHSGGFAEAIRGLVWNGFVKMKKCQCGQGNILYITAKGRKYARSLKK